MTDQQKAPAWQRVLVARAQGHDVDPADLAEARAVSKPGTVGWAARVAAQATPKREPAPEGPDRFRAALRAQLSGSDDDGPPAA
ncbi:hypothetical protein [Streptomyces fagopyri]